MKTLTNILVSLLVLSPLQLQAKPSVHQIIEKANKVMYYQGKDGRSKVRMSVYDKEGNKRVRQFNILRKNHQDHGKQNYLVLFTRPADLRGTVFMVTKHTDRDDDRWMYLPAMDLVKRIAGSDKRTSFVGSHFFYEDISGRNINADHHQLINTTDKHWVIRGTPKTKKDAEFAFYQAWISKKTGVPEKMEYTDKNGKRYRLLETLEVKTIDGYDTITKLKASDLISGEYTLVEMKGIQYDLSIPDNIFAERSLRNVPTKWLGRR